MRKVFVTAACVAALCGGQIASAATPYEAAVKALAPTYYYQLNEPNANGGVIDSMGNAAPGSYNGDYVDGLPEAGCPGPLFVNEGQDGGGEFEYEEIAVPGVGGEANLAHCSNNEGHIILGDSDNYGASAMTVAMFFKADFAQGGDRLFTNNLTDPATSFQVDVANDGLVVAVDPNSSGEFAERSLLTIDDVGPDRALIQADYGWFHIVASTFGADDERAENIQVWVNGINRTDNLLITEWGWGVDTDSAKIGGRHDDPLATTTHSGAQDEVSIWLDRVLTEDEVQSIWNAALSNVVVDPCDFNGDGTLDIADLDLLVAGVRSGANPAGFDVNGDGGVTSDDIVSFVEGSTKLNSYIGDANLDGEFNSTDFVNLFQSGQYEDGVAMNSTWSTGDFNGDGEFDSGDFVAAFQGGGYEVGPRVATAAVPEPSGLVLLFLGLVGAVKLRRN